MLKREDPSDTGASILALLLFILFLLMMYSQWWRTQVSLWGWAAVPLTPWAVSGLLIILVWGIVSYYVGLLGMRRLHKWMAWLPTVMAILAVMTHIASLMQSKFIHLSSFFGFFLMVEAPAYYAIHVFFYTPLAGLARLLPFLGVRMANKDYSVPMEPVTALVICLVYLVVSSTYYTLGKKAWEKSQESAPPNEPSEEAECMDTPHE